MSNLNSTQLLLRVSATSKYREDMEEFVGALSTLATNNPLLKVEIDLNDGEVLIRCVR